MTLPATVNTSNADAGTDSPAVFRSDVLDLINKFNQLLSHIPAELPTKAELLAQALNKGTTAGTSTAYTLSPAQAISSYAAGQSFWVTFHAASGGSPTLRISGIATTLELVRYTSTGGLVAIGLNELPLGFSSRVTLLSSTQALVEDLPPMNITSDAAGNVGFGVTPSAWGNSGPGQKAIQSLSWAVSNDVNSHYQTNNAYYSATNWTYIASKFATRYDQDSASGAHKWYTAPSGTAGSSIAFTQAMELTNAGQLQTLTTGGAALMDAYACRAWVNFNGTGTVAIRASGNVSSITDTGPGEYTVNFTNPMVDTNYSLVGTTEPAAVAADVVGINPAVAPTVSSVSVITHRGGSGNVDTPRVMLCVFR